MPCSFGQKSKNDSIESLKILLIILMKYIRPFEHQIQYVDRFAVINNASFSSSVYTSVINVKECIALDINM